MNQQDKLRRIPGPNGELPFKVQPTIPAPETKFAAQAACLSDSGSFIFQFAEHRPVVPYYVNPVTGETDIMEDKSANVVVARIAISPLAFVALKQAMEAAERYHVEHYGPLPDREKIFSKLVAEAPPAPPAVPDRVVGFRKNSGGKTSA